MEVDLEAFFVEFLLPVSIVVVLPVTIVWMAMRARQNETDKKTEALLKAIESGTNVNDIEYFKMPEKTAKGIKERLLKKLSGACVTSLMGAAFIVLGILNNNDLYNLVIPYVLMVGAILLAVGIALFITYVVGKKMLAKEIEAEEKALDNPRE